MTSPSSPQTLVTPVNPGGLDVPKDWADLGVARGWTPTPPDRLKLVLKGLPGTGKSTFVLSDPKTLVLDLEGMGGDSLWQQAGRVAKPSFQTMLRVLAKAVGDARAERSPFNRIAFDTGDHLESMIDQSIFNERKVEPKKMAHGSGYVMIRDKFMALLQDIEDAGMGWTVVLHLREKLLDGQGSSPVSVVREVLWDSLMAELRKQCHIVAELKRQVYHEEIPQEPITLADGSTKQLDPLRKHKTRIIMQCSPAESDDPLRTLKCRYIEQLNDLDNPITLGQRGGWETFTDRYLAALEACQQELTEQPQQ